MATTIGNPELVAFCGLYCGACRSYKQGNCPGCAENEKSGWCKIRACNQERGYATCADCTDFADVSACPKVNNFMARVFALIFRSDRPASIARIKDVGLEAYANEMAARGQMSFKRGAKR